MLVYSCTIHDGGLRRKIDAVRADAKTDFLKSLRK
jgi:hypothetical protein